MDEFDMEFCQEQQEFLQAAGIRYLRNNIENLANANEEVRRQLVDHNTVSDQHRLTTYYLMEEVLKAEDIPRTLRIWFFQKLTAFIDLNDTEAEHMEKLIAKIPPDTGA